MLLSGVETGRFQRPIVIADKTGQLRRRLVFFLFGLLLFFCLQTNAGAGVHPLARGVRIVASEVELPVFVEGHDFLPEAAGNTAGWGLLRFYGCVPCHRFSGTDSEDRWGPDLDRIGEKTNTAWLHRWLEDPAAAVPGAKMPRVVMSKEERAALVAFLQMQTSNAPEKKTAAGDPARGRVLFEAAQCRVCHIYAGQGGTLGPVLDRAAERIYRPWLVEFLQQPTQVVHNARMPDYGFSVRQAGDLAAFLLDETRGPAVDKSLGNARSQEQFGLSLFAEKGCARCHLIGAYLRPLEKPPAENAGEFVTYHDHPESADSPRINIKNAQVKAMAAALGEETTSTMPVSVGEFLSGFWQAPVSLQGNAPAAYDSLAVDLSSEACGGCHADQFADWRTTVHSRSMGPGVLGQLADGLWQTPGFVEGCQACHAPLAEQHSMLSDEDEIYAYNYQYSEGLQTEGLGCAACHVRGHTRLGPPLGGRPPVRIWQGVGHGGAVTTLAFQSSEFCKGCHQFEPDSRRVNGKLLQDTYNQWANSPQAAEGQTCQACHMPGRRHLWHGIHEPEMVREALKLEMMPVTLGPDSIRTEIRVVNVAAGHHLPTYVTPKIFVQVQLADIEGNPLVDSVQERAIGWEMVLGGVEGDEEVYDTRIPAGGAWVWHYAAFLPPGAVEIEVQLTVHPDHFYLKFFESYSRAEMSEKAAAMIDTAEENARHSPYQLLTRRWRLGEIR